MTVAVLALAAAMVAAPAEGAEAATGTTTRVSVASDGNQGSNGSFSPALTPDGRYVAFESVASNLVTGDTNNEADIFVRDNQTGTVTRVSVANDGSQANNSSTMSALSADGRYVVFRSGASSLVAGDSGSAQDVFFHDRQTATTTRVANKANLGDNPAISADGRYVAFDSTSANVVAGDTNAAGDVFIHDNHTGETTRASVSSDIAGQQGQLSSFDPAISGNGRYVSFTSAAPNLVVGDTNGADDVFVHDRQTGTTSRVSVHSDGTQLLTGGSDPAITADGRFVSFTSAFSFIQNTQSPVRNVFVHDRQNGTTTQASVTTAGTSGNGHSEKSGLSDDGRYVGFISRASNLVAGDGNGWPDVFVHDRQSAPPLWPA